jgi:hypothetical protein
MGYDSERSKHTIASLGDEALGRVREAARTFSHPGWYEGIDAGHLVEFLVLSGAHPSVLADPVGHGLRAEARKAHLHVLWDRPKKRGIAAAMDLPLVRLGTPEAEWIPSFIESVRARPYTTVYLNRLLREIGEKAGVPISARTLRHTCGVRVGRKTRDIATVLRWLNCSKANAAEYLRVATSDDPRMLEVAD